MQFRYNLDAIQIQFRCNIDVIQMLRCNRDVIQTYSLVLNSYLTFTDRVGVAGWGGVVGDMGNKAISAFNSVEVEVEAELGKKTVYSSSFGWCLRATFD